jgi:RsiW-degrading membrane proteinase PrsW (M82 family)
VTVKDAGTGPSAGWYEDPSASGGLRWWNGDRWTGFTARPPADGTETPSKARDSRKWLGPYGGLMIGGAFAIFWLYLLFVVIGVFGDSSPIPSVLLLGGFAVASAFVYTMCYRLRPADELKPSLLLLIFLVGGFAATMIPLCAEPVIRFATVQADGDPALVLSLVAGPIEEFSKILVVVLVARWVPVRTARTGLFVGGAVGFGFSGFEDLEYGLSAISGHHGPDIAHLVGIALAREASGPFAHPLWTSLLAAAVYAAWGSGRFRITWRMVGAFVLAAAAHTLWDTVTPAWYLVFGNQPESAVVGFIAVVLLAGAGTLIWWHVARRSRGVAAPSAPPRAPDDASSPTTGAPTL